MAFSCGSAGVSIWNVGVAAAAGAIFASITAGPVGLTALAFAVSAAAHGAFVGIAAAIGISCDNKPLLVTLMIGTSILVTTISILAMHAFGIIATTGAIVLAALSACAILISLGQAVTSITATREQAT